MATNKIKALRKKLNMTQAELAKKAKTSQQQVQRIESGAQLTRLDLAHRIAAALGTKVETVFPAAALAMKQLGKAGDAAINDEKLRERFVKSGIDLDPHQWSLWLRFRNGMERQYQLDGEQYSRLWSKLQNCDDLFIHFDAPDLAVAFNKKQLARWQFRFDPPSIAVAEKEAKVDEEGEPITDVSIWFNDCTTPEIYLVEPDTEEFGESENDEGCDFQALLYDLVHLFEDTDEFSFLDEDGERVFVHGSAVSLIEIPAIVVRPSLYEEYLERVPEDEAPAAGVKLHERRDLH